MKTNTMIVIAAAFGLAGAAHAEEPRKDRPHRDIPPEVIEKFDKDGDGKLNEEERQAARAAGKERMEAKRKEMIAKFDKDGDGELSEAERAEMRKEMGGRPGGPKGKGPKGKGGKGGKRGGADVEAPGAGE